MGIRIAREYHCGTSRGSIKEVRRLKPASLGSAGCPQACGYSGLSGFGFAGRRACEDGESWIGAGSLGDWL